MKHYISYAVKAFIATIAFFGLTIKVSMAHKSASDLLKAAKTVIENLTPAKARWELSKASVVLIDLREAEELKQSRKIPGSVHAPGGTGENLLPKIWNLPR